MRSNPAFPSRRIVVVRMYASMIPNPSKDEALFFGRRLLVWRHWLSSYRLLQFDVLGFAMLSDVLLPS